MPLSVSHVSPFLDPTLTFVFIINVNPSFTFIFSCNSSLLACWNLGPHFLRWNPNFSTLLCHLFHHHIGIAVACILHISWFARFLNDRGCWQMRFSSVTDAFSDMFRMSSSFHSQGELVIGKAVTRYLSHIRSRKERYVVALSITTRNMIFCNNFLC
jgi:hypothetical protein